MAPSTRHIDDLLEWVPGPSAAASVGVIEAFAWGARRAAQGKWLLVLLWIGYVLVAAGGIDAPPAMPFGDTAWQALLTGSSVRRLFVATPWFVLLYGLLAGGAINWLRAPRPAPLLAQLGAACGWYAGRFLRLLLAAAIVSTLLAWALGAAVVPGEPGAGPLALLALCSMLPAAIVDYARVRAGVRDSRSMVLELARTVRFFVRNLPRLILLELLIAALGGAVGLLAFGIAAAATRLLSAPIGAAIGTQVLIVALLWLRLAAWGAMLSLHQGLTLRRLQERVS